MISYLAIGCKFKSVSEARESSCWRARRTRARLICETKPKIRLRPPLLQLSWFLGLLGLFGPLTLAETDVRAAAVLIDEFERSLSLFSA